MAGQAVASRKRAERRARGRGRLMAGPATIEQEQGRRRAVALRDLADARERLRRAAVLLGTQDLDPAVAEIARVERRLRADPEAPEARLPDDDVYLEFLTVDDRLLLKVLAPPGIQVIDLDALPPSLARIRLRRPNGR